MLGHLFNHGSPNIRRLQVTTASRCSYSQHASALDPFKILFFGRDEFSCLVFEDLHKAKDVWQDLEIVTNPDEKVGRRGSQLSVSPLKILGETLHVPVHTIPRKKPDFRHWQPPPLFLDQHPSHLILTASFGRILPNPLLELFHPQRRLNVHPSLLPMYRGPAPIQHTLLDGRTETGVCVIEMLTKGQGIDAGGVWGWKRVPIPQDATFTSLRDHLAHEGGQLLVMVLRQMLSGKAVSVRQSDLVLSTETKKASAITMEDAMVNFKTMTAADILRRYRAISHQKPLTTHLPTSKTLQLHDLVVHPTDLDEPSLPKEPGAAVYDGQSRSILLRCASGTVLSVGRVKQQDRSMLTAKEWWNGWKSFCGREWRGSVVFSRSPAEQPG